MTLLIVYVLVLAIVAEAITEIVVDSKLFEPIVTKIRMSYFDIVEAIRIIEAITIAKAENEFWPELCAEYSIGNNIQTVVRKHIEKVKLGKSNTKLLSIKACFWWWLYSITSCGYCFSVYAAFTVTIAYQIPITGYVLVNYFLTAVLVHRLSNLFHNILSKVSTERMKYLTITMDKQDGSQGQAS